MDNPPNHYNKLPIQSCEIIKMVLDALPKNTRPIDYYNIGNALKYRLRAGYKDSMVDDVQKAMSYEREVPSDRIIAGVQAHG